jgi:hypothetical protein
MPANVIGAGGVPDSTYGSPRHPFEDQPAAPAPATAVSPGSPPGPDDLTLTIESDREGGGFVYTTIDRRTGAVVQKLSRAQLLKLREASGYVAGAVLSTRA